MTADPRREAEARRAFLRSTEPDDAVRGRLEARIGRALRVDPTAREVAARVTTVSAPALGRIRARLQRSRRPDRPWRRALPLALAAAACALASIGWWTAPRGVARALDHVALSLDGEGTVGGTDERPRIAWVEGTLGVRVTPDRGVDLAITTPEALVEVVGTTFTVARQHHGTTVRVTEGKVRVTCVALELQVLGPGEEVRCLPADAPSLLLRAAELTQAGSAAEDRLDATTRALAAGPAALGARAEILAQRSAALAALGRTGEAEVAAGEYLATGEPARRPELLAFVAQRRFEREGCGAADALEAAVAATPAGPEALLLATCLLEADPARARALVSAAGPSATGDWAALAERLSGRLGSSR